MLVVIKIGSNVLFGDKDYLDLELIKSLVKEISELAKNHQVIIVTSGAVAIGQEILQKKNILKSTSASLGQSELIKHYKIFFESEGIQSAQILLSPNSFKERTRYDYLKKTLQQLIDLKILPIINENDVIALGKETFFDNDSLAAMIAIISNADKLIFLTNVDGLYSGNPVINKDAFILREVKNIDLEIQKMAFNKKSQLGQGGILSKIKGAKLSTSCGIETFIINGLTKNNLINLLIKKETIGTKFIAQKNNLSERKKWLLIGNLSRAKIIVDQGAKEALKKKNSLLAVGVRNISGEFTKRDFVNIIDSKGEIFAFGLVNYDSKELLSLAKMRDKIEIRKRYPLEIIHTDNIVLLN